MKNRQLMRLNKVLHNGEVKTVDCISPGNVSFLEDRHGEDKWGKWIDLDDVEFIPLTEEWLLKLGFKLHSKYSYHNYILGDGFCISIWMESLPCAGFEETGVCYWGENYITIKNVHNLQNLYFALTGKELVINDVI